MCWFERGFECLVRLLRRDRQAHLRRTHRLCRSIQRSRSCHQRVVRSLSWALRRGQHRIRRNGWWELIQYVGWMSRDLSGFSSRCLCPVHRRGGRSTWLGCGFSLIKGFWMHRSCLWWCLCHQLRRLMRLFSGEIVYSRRWCGPGCWGLSRKSWM